MIRFSRGPPLANRLGRNPFKEMKMSRAPSILVVTIGVGLAACGERSKTTSFDGGPDMATDGDAALLMGDAQDGLPCTSQVGTGTVQGTVKGEVLTASHAAGMTVKTMGGTGYGVSFIKHATGGSCKVLSKTVSRAEVGLMLCSTKPGTYKVGTACPGSQLRNGVHLPQPGTVTKATSGTITIIELDPGCGGRVRGSFSAQFGTEKVTGSFSTVGCGVVTAE
jgi:hypothetical protein